MTELLFNTMNLRKGCEREIWKKKKGTNLISQSDPFREGQQVFVSPRVDWYVWMPQHKRRELCGGHQYAGILAHFGFFISVHLVLIATPCPRSPIHFSPACFVLHHLLDVRFERAGFTLGTFSFHSDDSRVTGW
jgi:hypothetical protein